jgi:maltose O-acetyltransferase
MSSPFGRLSRAAAILRSLWRLWYFVRIDGSTHRRIQVGANARFDVPVRSNGRGSIEIGPSNTFGFALSHRLGNGEILIQARTPEAEIRIGSRNVFNNNCAIYSNRSVTIGNECLIGDSVLIYDSDFHNLQPEIRRAPDFVSAPVVVGNNVWVGTRAIILKGVTIGDDAVIGAMSVVTNPVPSRCVAAGNPARVIRELK